jgi:hypothetical protein
MVSEVRASLSGLDAWLSDSPFGVKFDWEKEAFTIQSQPPPVREFTVDDNLTVSFLWHRDGPSISRYPSFVTVRAWPVISVRYHVPVRESEAREAVLALADLFSVLFGAATTPRDLIVYSPQHVSDFGEPPPPRDMRVLESFIQRRNPHGTLYPHDVLMPYEVLAAQFGEVLNRWFRMRRECWGAIVPYVASQRRPAAFAESRLFDCAATAESIHRHFRPNDVQFTDNEARAVCKAAKQCIPREVRHAFANAVTNVNALTYMQRLRALLDRIPEIAQDVIGNAYEQRKFCLLVKDLRNMQAHRGSHGVDSQVSGDRLVRITSKVKAIIDAWVLLELGVDNATVYRRMRSTHRYWFYASNTTWPWNRG